MAVPLFNVARARAFVLAHGSAVDVARLEGLLGRTEPERGVVRELEGLQNPDGGFPGGQESGGPSSAGQQPGDLSSAEQQPDGLGAVGPQSAGPSSIAATCEVLAQLRDIPPLAGSPMASRAVAFLRRSQGVDGSWSEPGAEPAYLTARAAYALAVMEPDHPDPIRRAGKWLHRALAGGAEGTSADGGECAAADGAESVASPTLFLAAAVWGHTGEAGAQDSVHALLERRELTAPELAGWLTTFAELGLAARHMALALRLLERLAGMQQPDGSWPGGEGSSVEATLAALRVFRGLGVVGHGGETA